MKFVIPFVFLFFLALQSCEDPSNVGNGVIPPDDALPVDSLKFSDFVMNTITDDSLFNSFRTPVIIGETVQGFFGTGQASYFTEVGLSGEYEVVSNPVLDSVIMYLRVPGYSGEEDIPQTFEVFTMADTIPSDEFFLIDQEFAVDTKIGEFTDVEFSDDEVEIDDRELPFHIKTELDLALFQDILNDLNAEVITDNMSLQDKLLGIAVKPLGNQTGRGVFSIDVLRVGTVTGIRLYYKDSANESHTFDLSFGIGPDRTVDGETSAGIYNHNQLIVDNNTGDPQINIQVDNVTTNGHNQGYLQSGHGIYTSLHFETLLDDLEPDYRINSARLTIRPILNDLADTILLPSTIGLYEEFEVNDDGEQNGGLIGIDGSGLPSRDPDRLYDSFTTANLFRESEGEYVYTFVLPNYIERFINNLETGQLYLFTTDRRLSFRGIVFDKSLSEPGIELDIKYTQP